MASKNQQKTFQKRKLRFSCACHQFGFHFRYIFNQFWWDFHTFTTHPPLPCNKMMPATHPGSQRTRHRFVLVFRWCPKPFLEKNKRWNTFRTNPQIIVRTAICRNLSLRPRAEFAVGPWISLLMTPGGQIRTKQIDSYQKDNALNKLTACYTRHLNDS